MQEKELKIKVVGKIPEEVKKFSSLVNSLINIEVSSHFVDSSQYELEFNEKTESVLMVLILDTDTAPILKKLSIKPIVENTNLLVIAKEENSMLMRLAMKAGAKDYICEPINLNDLTITLNRIIYEIRNNQAKISKVTSVIGVRGGDGASFIACNLAHICATHSTNNTLLLDLDFQCPTQSLYFDIQSEYAIIDILEKISTLDISAFESYLAQHNSNLKLLTNITSDHLYTPDEALTTSIKQMMGLISNYYDHIFIDLPRQLNLDSAVVLDKSDTIIIVMSQTVADVHHAKVLLNTLKKDLEISGNKIRFVINKYQDNSTLNIKFIADFLEFKNIGVIPQDDNLVSKSLNLGKPMFDIAEKSKVTEHLVKLTTSLDIKFDKKSQSTNILSKLFGKN